MKNKILVLSLIAASALFSAGANAQQCNSVSVTSIRASDDGTVLTTSGAGTNCGFNAGGFICIPADAASSNRQYAAALTAQASNAPVTIAWGDEVGCGGNIPVVTEIRVLPN